MRRDLFREAISGYSLSELNEIFEAFKKIRGTDLFFSFGKVTVRPDITRFESDGKIYSIPTDHAYLELERIRKNRLLKDFVGKTVKVAGIVENVKFDAGLFCLSPCYINGEDIGHTWTRYDPRFKGIKLGSTVGLFSEIKRYGDVQRMSTCVDGKSGVNWEEAAYIKILGGDNSCLHRIPLRVSQPTIQELPGDLIYTPGPVKLKRFDFEPYMDKEIYIDTYKKTLFVSEESVSVTPETQLAIEKLLFFEWLTKLQDYEFWHYVNKRSAK